MSSLGMYSWVLLELSQRNLNKKYYETMFVFLSFAVSEPFPNFVQPITHAPLSNVLIQFCH